MRLRKTRLKRASYSPNPQRKGTGTQGHFSKRLGTEFFLLCVLAFSAVEPSFFSAFFAVLAVLALRPAGARRSLRTMKIFLLLSDFLLPFPSSIFVASKQLPQRVFSAYLSGKHDLDHSSGAARRRGVERAGRGGGHRHRPLQARPGFVGPRRRNRGDVVGGVAGGTGPPPHSGQLRR